MKFNQVAVSFERISQHTSRIEITKILAELFTSATPEESAIISYFTLGSLRAPYKGTQFNYAEKSMIKVVATLIGQTLEECKITMQTKGDIGSCIETSNWPYTDHNLSLSQIYEQLYNFEVISGLGSQEERSEFLKKLLIQVDALSARFIVRIILGQLRLGFSDMTLLDALSWMETGNKSLHDALEHAYNMCADIGLIAFTLKAKGVAGLERIHPVIGIPIRPAAAERLPNAQAIIDKLGSCVAQPKLDGFRLQIHLDNTGETPCIWFFSRNLIDMSAMFPDLVAVLKHVSVTNLIVEGEAIMFDEDRGAFVPFQETVKRKRKHDIEQMSQEMPLRLYIFDILYLNNASLLSLSHTQRRKILIDTFGIPEETDIVQVIAEQKVDTGASLQAYFNQEISQGLEGVVVKRPESKYQPGKRNFNWIKLKRVQKGHLEDTIDAVVLGYNYGKGKRASFGIGAFLVGVYNKSKDRFETIAKVGTGLKDADLKDLKERCDALVVPEKPHNVDVASELTPDVWVDPKIVVVVLADEITQSPLHTAGASNDQNGLALRFPRFIGYSIDKSPEQATSIQEIKRMYQDQYLQKTK